MKERFVLRNVKRVTGENIDIVIDNGKIVEITKGGCGRNNKVFDYTDADVYVSSGWIDLHVHAFPEFSPYGDEIDEIGIKLGVTTIVDAGSCGADRMDELVKSKESAKTNLFAFLNISRIGLQRIDELSNLDWIDKEKAKQTIIKYRDTIVGLKARISKSVVRDTGIEPLHIARELSNETGLPLMVHIGSAPPSIEEVIPLLEKQDVITHYLNGKTNNLFDDQGKPLQLLLNAIKRGVHLDVGHGNASFSFQVAEAAKRHHISLNTISTDIYRKNRLNGPVFSMANVLSKFLYLGYSLDEVIAAVTTNAATWLGKPELGRIKVGDVANLTLFSVEHKPMILIDSEGEKRETNQSIEAKGVVVNGEFIEC
ncbi:amidohydrolase/deacetylase family metallohydrolase [Lysinibacillus xylanilyticus]|uniref:amidohydrolase/deacetylase family metallohydrolase n=1 Tax=Lysinibacillus xylanilyticus TaxID=582475 RepID=UPI0038006251